MQIRLRDGVGFIFGFPVDTEDPPALAIIKKLKAIDAARERLGVIFGVTGFVGAPYLSDVVPEFCAVGDRVFKKSFFVKKRLASRSVLIGCKNSDAKDTLRILSARHESRSGVEERTETVPIAFAGGAGDYVVERRQQVFGRIHISGARRRSRI